VAEKSKLRKNWHQTRSPHVKTLLNRANQNLSP